MRDHTLFCSYGRTGPLVQQDDPRDLYGRQAAIPSYAAHSGAREPVDHRGVPDADERRGEDELLYVSGEN